MIALLNLSTRGHILILTVLTLLMTLPGLASIPAIDRDEARYATSSVQMAQSGDWLNIRFHDEARNKKPAGAYWAQSAMLHAVSSPDALAAGERPLWAQRLPSVIAGLIAVWVTYAVGLLWFGRGGAFVAAAMLGSSMIFVFEAHIAKTDALLLATTMAMLLALVRLRIGKARGSAWLFWIAAGLSLMIKGPIGPGIAVLALLTLGVWERRAGWMRPLLSFLPIIAFLLIWVPWLIAINIATDGAFLAESLGRDLGGKMVSAQETHSGPPGYYALTLFVSLWPASLLLLPGLAWGWTRARMTDDPIQGLARLAIAWIVPFWLVLELAPTKLIHYPLPLFPALCLLMSGALLAMSDRGGFGRVRRVSALLFALSGLVIAGVIVTAQLRHGAPQFTGFVAVLVTVSGGLTLLAAVTLWRGQGVRAVGWALVAAILLSVPTYGVLMPSIEDGRTSEQLAELPGRLYSIHYTEPSLVYYAGTDRVVLDGELPWDQVEVWRDGTLLLDRASGVSLDRIDALVTVAGRCVRLGESIAGFKYSNFEAVELIPVRQVTC